MERSNRIPMEIFRLATRNENQRTNGPETLTGGPDPPPPSRNLKSLRLRQYFTILVGPPLVKMSGSANQGHPRVIILSNYDGLESSMLHTDFRENRPAGSGEEDF